MATKRRKFYVVWVGREPGIYDNWDDAQEQVLHFEGARYKSFDDLDEATAAYRGSDDLGIMRQILHHDPSFGKAKPKRSTAKAREEQRVYVPELSPGVRDFTAIPGVRLDAIAVDGACAGNPGRMEYRAVRVIDSAEVFHVGGNTTYIGTNNIAEYLAMIHLAALLAARGDSTTPIYTDSKNTLAWLRRGGSRTTLARRPDTTATLDLLARADAWLAANGPIRNPILKWPTELWGEIPADFGRKSK